MGWVWIPNISNIPLTAPEAAINNYLQPGPALVLAWQAAQDTFINLFVQCLPSQTLTPVLSLALQELIL